MSMEENRLTHIVPTLNNTTRNPTSSSSSSSSSSQIPSLSSLSLLEPNTSCNNTAPSAKETDIIKGKEEVHDNEEDNNGEIEGEEVTGRERLKRHREEVKGNVKIPENWGQEKLLKDWIDHTTFDALLAPRHRLIVAARDALVADGRKASARSQRLRIHI